MLKEERLQGILKTLEADKKVRLFDLSAALGVSEDTIRRDIRELSDRGLLTMVRGGAIPHAPGPKTYTDRVHFANLDKQIIARKALQFFKG